MMHKQSTLEELHKTFVSAVANFSSKEDLKILVGKMVCASAPWPSRYSRIKVEMIMQENLMDRKVNVEIIIVALEVLEKYGKNLLKEHRPMQWRTVRISNSVFSKKVDVMAGSRQILQLFGYTEKIPDGFSFPCQVQSPNKSEVIVVLADVVQLKLELSMILKGNHPRSEIFHYYLQHNAPFQSSICNDQTLRAGCRFSMPAKVRQDVASCYKIDEMCAVCGQKLAEFQCKTCNKLQCGECDKIWHQYPNRVAHQRFKYEPGRLCGETNLKHIMISSEMAEVCGPPSAEYVLLPLSSLDAEGKNLRQRRKLGENMEHMQQPSTDFLTSNLMTIQAIHDKTEHEDNWLRCIEMIDFIRETERIGYTLSTLESAIADCEVEQCQDSGLCTKELLNRKMLLAKEKTKRNSCFNEVLKNSEEKCAAFLNSCQTCELKQFHFRLGEKKVQDISYFLQKDKQRTHHALVSSFSLRSEAVGKMMNALLTYSYNTVLFLSNTNCDITDVIEAAKSFPENIDGAKKYLKNQCMLCLEMFSQSKVECMTTCSDSECKYCYKCLEQYLIYKITEGNIRDIVCPVCKLPDMDGDEETTANYFNYLDVVVRTRMDSSIHTMFQQKLRDQTLMKMHNFRWCSYCTNGFLFEHEESTLKMVCPSCCKATCYNCKKRWETQHEGVSCENFSKWKQLNDPDFQAAGLAALLKENGIDCPNCKFKYDLAKGGCMHFRCLMCSFQFCSGCKRPFKQGKVCTVLPSCHRKGLHAHHPRDCLFYLRDMDVQALQSILIKSNIEYRALCITTSMYCQVSEQKETSTGLVDDICGRRVHGDNTGLCILHFKEYLVNLINNNKLDPAEVFTKEELITCLKRVEASVPEHISDVSDGEYLMCLLEKVQNLPLVHQQDEIAQNRKNVVP